MEKNNNRKFSTINNNTESIQDKGWGDIYSNFLGSEGGAMGGNETKMTIEAYERRLISEEKESEDKND